MTADAYAGILDAIHAAPTLERGLCVGHWDLWDATDDAATVAHAMAGLRLLLGFVFLWAFFDKLFGWHYATASGTYTDTITYTATPNYT